MKNQFILSLLFTILIGVFSIEASDKPIQMHKKGTTHNNHSGTPITPADMPSVYYDDVSQEIIIDGNGYSAYYDVDIVSESTLLTLLSANVDGDYGTVDVSSLPDDNYTIVITSSNNNEYTGQFTNY